MDPDKFPEVTSELLQELEKLYPEKPVLPGMTMDSLMHYGGQRALIKWLREVHDAQQQVDQGADGDDETTSSLLDVDQEET